MPTHLLSELLEKEMTRKEFLLHMGALLLVLSGITALLKTVADPNLGDRWPGSGPTKVSHGFGSGPYGN